MVDRGDELIGSPNDRVKVKLRPEVDDTAREFIDPTTLAIPEHKGNALGFGPRNVLATGRIGLIFMVPGQRESYRVNGTARLSRDPELLGQLAVDEKPALMATIVGVEEAFFHCGTAMIRSKLWAGADETEADRQPIAEQISGPLGDESLVPVIAADLEENYRTDLYWRPQTAGSSAPLRCGVASRTSDGRTARR